MYLLSLILQMFFKKNNEGGCLSSAGETKAAS
jgi:hypothetical protein